MQTASNHVSISSKQRGLQRPKFGARSWELVPGKCPQERVCRRANASKSSTGSRRVLPPLPQDLCVPRFPIKLILIIIIITHLEESRSFVLNRYASAPTPEQSPSTTHRTLDTAETIPRFFFAGPRQTLLVDSVQETVKLPAADPGALRSALADISKRSAPGHWVGALPFDNTLPCHLLRPRSVKSSVGWPPPAPLSIGSPPAIEQISTSSTRETYQASVERALEQISSRRA